MSEKAFDDIVDRVQTFYDPLVRHQNAIPKLTRNWSDPEFEAHAKRIGNSWEVYVSGGLARVLGADGLMYTLCHEVGHQLAGYPFNDMQGVEWLSKEGAADYYASFVCLKALWKNELAATVFLRSKVDAFAKKQCDQAWKSVEDKLLCYRITTAGKIVIDFWSDQSKSPKASFSSTEVKKEFSPQCRLDTILQGALCTAHFDLDLIPGYPDHDGINSERARLEAEKNSCTKSGGYTHGVRPECWYP